MMQIQVEGLTREYKMLNRREGVSGSVKDLFSRNYNRIKAVDDISFCIEQGEIVGFIGPNGAGKSTTIKMLTGLMKPTSGEIKIYGYDLNKNKKKYLKNIGVVFGQRSQLWWEIPVIESFKLLKDIYEIKDKDYVEKMDMFDELVNIKALYNTPVRNLSLGQRMLCDIVAAFLHNPQIIFLDEPTIGLDVNIKNKIRKMIRHLNHSLNITIILTTHDTEDIEELAQRIILIDKGHIIYDGESEKFNHLFGSYKTIKVKFSQENFPKISFMKEAIYELFQNRKDIMIVENKLGWLDININSKLDSMNNIIIKILNICQFEDVIVSEMDLCGVLQQVYSNM